MKLFLYSLVIIHSSGLRLPFGEHKLAVLDYGIDWHDITVTKKTDIRSKFLDDRRKNMNSKKIISTLSVASDDIEYSEGIPHYKVSNTMKSLQEIRTMEDNFKSMVKMNGVKYDYKRDMHWRTWREVTYPNKSRIVICYRCENLVNSSSETCHSSGTWAIEENLQCPYEIFSLKKDNEICAINYNQINKINKECPMTVKLSDLRNCNNPLETKYMLKRDYDTASGRNTVMCKEREFCEIRTIYEISPNETTFRIINSSNHVIYSRIMKSGGKNFACINDCGFYDPASKKISTNEKPFIVNLLDKSHKNKREFLFAKKVHGKLTKTSIDPFKIGMKIFKNPSYRIAKQRKQEREELRRRVPGTTMSGCRKMTTTTNDYEMEEYFEEFP